MSEAGEKTLALLKLSVWFIDLSITTTDKQMKKSIIMVYLLKRFTVTYLVGLYFSLLQCSLNTTQYYTTTHHSLVLFLSLPNE